MMNKVIIIGYLGRDPEIKYVGETELCKFSVATTETFTAKGEKKQNTEWFNVAVWGKRAESCHRYLAKGALVYVEGVQTTEKWEKDGQQKQSTTIRATEVKFLSLQKDASDEAPLPKKRKTNTQWPDDAEYAPPHEDDMPF